MCKIGINTHLSVQIAINKMTKIAKSIMPLPLWHPMWGWPLPSVSAGAAYDVAIVKSWCSSTAQVIIHQHFTELIGYEAEQNCNYLLLLAHAAIPPAFHLVLIQVRHLNNHQCIIINDGIALQNHKTEKKKKLSITQCNSVIQLVYRRNGTIALRPLGY